MTTFDENNINRDTTGRFDEKLNTAPEAGLPDEDRDVHLFSTDIDGVEFDVSLVLGGFTASGDDGNEYRFDANCDIEDHDSIEDALRYEIDRRLGAAIGSLTLVGDTGDIAGYTYQADNYKPDELLELLIAQGRLAPGARRIGIEQALNQLAGEEGIERDDAYTFDTDEFPKVILQYQLSTDDLDWLERGSKA